MKKSKNTKEAWDIQDRREEDEARACVQWKGTDVCMDLQCECGAHSHIDSYFAYHVKCPVCGKVYFCNGHIELILLEEEPEYCIVTGEI